MHFYLDGYNLLFSLIDSKQPLALQRESLIRFLQKQFMARKIKGMLIFDGAHRREEESGLLYGSPLEIAYAPKGQSADSYIVEQLEKDPQRKQAIVVTNDRGLTLHARALRAKVQGNTAFIEFLKKRPLKTEKPRIVETEKNIERLLKIFEERLQNGDDLD